MIRKLRIKFIIIAMCSITVVLLIIMGSINLVNYNRIDNRANEILEILSENEGFFPKSDDRSPMGRPRPLPPETPYETRYFTALINRSGDIVAINTRSVTAIATDEAIEYADRAWNSSRKDGYDGVYKYLTAQTFGGTLIVFLDCSRDLTSFRSFLIISIVVSAIGIAAVFILVVILSKIAVKPVAESYEKQKRFITDASHEIKTPLTIIDANTEVLEIGGGENEWTKSIKKQVQRLSDLTANLIALSRMDEGNIVMTTMEFSLSEAVEDSIEPFLALIKAQNKTFSLDIQSNINYNGNEKSIRQLVSILADNAIKHSNENSTISVTLKKHGRYSELIFSNGVDHMDKGNLNIVFERFYRADSSRSAATGGHGIGLSIAKAIVLSHRGKIKAESSDGKSITITVQL